MSGIKIVIIQDIVPSGMDYDSIQAHPAAQRGGGGGCIFSTLIHA